jgi:type VI secretion system protein ImpI
MALHLRIENETTLPDGGPVSITVNGKRGIDIGRDAHLDWTLPDPTRYISSKHAEIRYREGAYWLHDVSTNGTLLNGSDHRMQAPHRLRDGDRITIGHYIIAVAVDDEAGDPGATAPPATPGPTGYQELWDNVPDIAPPIDREQLRAPRDRPAPVNPDFLDWATDVPSPGPISPQSSSAPPRPAEDVMDWSAGPRTPEPPPPPLPPHLPEPRRPQRETEAMASWSPEPREAATPSGRPATPFERPATPFERPARQTPPAEPAVNSIAVDTPDAFLQRLALAAGIPADLLANKDPAQFADELGAMLHVMVESLMQLLNARHQARLLARSSRHTVIQAFENNPLKFSPNVEEALRTMFGPPTRAYLNPLDAIQRGFADLKQHEIKTFSAMQHALAAFVSELDPNSIDQSTQADSGISALVTSRKAKLWDVYVARWQAQMIGQGGSAVDRFMLLFAEFYDRDNV